MHIRWGNYNILNVFFVSGRGQQGKLINHHGLALTSYTGKY